MGQEYESAAEAVIKFKMLTLYRATPGLVAGVLRLVSYLLEALSKLVAISFDSQKASKNFETSNSVKPVSNSEPEPEEEAKGSTAKHMRGLSGTASLLYLFGALIDSNVPYVWQIIANQMAKYRTTKLGDINFYKSTSREELVRRLMKYDVDDPPCLVALQEFTRTGT